MIKTIYLNTFQYNGREVTGDWYVMHRFQSAQFFWSSNGLIIGGLSSRIVIETSNNTINCSPGDVIPWGEILGSWDIRFPDGIVFAKGEVEIVDSYDRWIECLKNKYISSSDALDCLDYLLYRKNASFPMSWKEFSSLMKIVEDYLCSVNHPGEESSSVYYRQRWEHYKLHAAIHEMTLSPPSCDAINWLKDYFSMNQ